MFDNKDKINEALVALAELMQAKGVGPYELLVCGGSALNVLGLVGRPTRDIDAISLVRESEDGGLVFDRQDKVPAELMPLVDQLGKDLGLDDKKDMPDDKRWLNFGPARLLDFGLPEGIEKRLDRRSYGEKLVVHFIRREDQIPLKLYACLLSPDSSRHEMDLVKLDPSEAEMRGAVLWILHRPVRPRAREVLGRVLDDFGYGNILKTIPT